MAHVLSGQHNTALVLAGAATTQLLAAGRVHLIFEISELSPGAVVDKGAGCAARQRGRFTSVAYSCVCALQVETLGVIRLCRFQPKQPEGGG